MIDIYNYVKANIMQLGIAAGVGFAVCFFGASLIALVF